MAESVENEKRNEIQNEQVLVAAAKRGDYEKIVELLFSGVSVDAEEYNKQLFYESKNYVTPLQIAAANGHDKCVQLLIDFDADVNAKDRFDVTALHMAAEEGHYLCVKALLDAGADCCVRTKFSKAGCYTAVPHFGGTNPLHLAAANNNVECVKELIQFGADYNAVDERGRTSLYIAAQAGYDECVLAHLKNAVGRDILSLPCFETSDTPLHFAVARGMVECVKELLYLGSDVNHMNHLGCSPLHLALAPPNEKGLSKMEVLELLILEGYNTDINRPDATGFTPLHYVCFNGYRNLWCRRPDMAKFLIAYGANVDIKNTQGVSLIELELKSTEKNYDILKHVVRSMLQLPHLKTLNIGQAAPSAPRVPPGGEGWNTAQENADARSAALVSDMLMVPLETNMMLNVPMWLHRPQSLRQRVRYPARQPLLMQVYDAIEGIIDEQNVQENDNEVESCAQWDSHFALKKQLWYEKLASNPRTLQHHCRYVIRTYMGPKRLKYIRKLPIPTLLQSYLLLEYGE